MRNSCQALTRTRCSRAVSRPKMRRRCARGSNNKPAARALTRAERVAATLVKRYSLLPPIDVDAVAKRFADVEVDAIPGRCDGPSWASTAHDHVLSSSSSSVNPTTTTLHDGA